MGLLPAVAQGGVKRWPHHSRRRAQDSAAPSVQPGFAAAQSSVEKQFISVRARDGGDTLPQIQ